MAVEIALLLDHPYLEEWQLRSVQNVLESCSDASLSVVIVKRDRTDQSSSGNYQSHDFANLLWKVYTATRLAKQRYKGKPWYRELTALDDAFDLHDVQIQSCTPNSAEDIGNELPAYATDLLSKIDIALRFGFGFLRGEALDAPTFGVLSYHHGDIEEYRGKPAGWYEFLHNEDTAGVTVQRLSETLDGGEIASKTACDIGDAASWGEVKSTLFEASPPLLPIAVENVIEGHTQPSYSLGDLYTTPSNRDVAHYVIKRILN